MRARPITTATPSLAFGEKPAGSISPAIALLPLGVALFHSSYEMAMGPATLSFEVLAILFAWFAAFMRSPPLNSLLRFLAYFLIVSIGVILNALRTGEIFGPLYFFQGMLFLSVALLPAVLGLTRRECLRIAFIFLALFLIKLAMTNLSFGTATSDYDAPTQFTFNIGGQAVRRAAILNFHANAFALTATMMTLYSLFLYLLKNNRFFLVFYAVHVGVTANIVLLTFSRSGFMSFAIATIIALCAIQSKRSSQFIGLLFAGGVVACALAFVIDTTLISYFFETRMEGFTSQATENKRVGFVQRAAADWAAAGPFDWIFGSGFMHHYTDSTWPAIPLNLGFIGVGVLLAGVYALGKCVLRTWRIKRDSAILLLAVLCALFLYGFSTEFWAVRKVLAPAALLFGLVHHEARLSGIQQARRPVRQ